MTSLQPTLKDERIQVLDVLRGIAIFGILFVNLAHFSYPDVYLSVLGKDNFFTEKWSDLDFGVRMILDLLIQTKFILLFSFLFGFGMVVMMERSLSKGQRFVPLYIRRLLALLILGTIHAFLVWDGDILTQYALLGFILLLFRKAKMKTLVIWAAALYLMFSIPFFLSSFSPSEGQEWKQETIQQIEQEAKQTLQVYSSGNFKEIAEQRIHDRMAYMSMNGMLTYNPLVFFLASIPYFSMFLLGAAAAKAGLLHQPEKHRQALKRVWLAGLIIGVGSHVLYGLFEKEAFMLIGAPFLMFFYVTTIVYLYHKTRFAKPLQYFSAVGRTAFTNYLMQSVIGTWIFYHFGLGLYGKVYPAAGILVTIAICALQMIVSHLWLRTFRMGPFEWLWRSATYLKWQPIFKESK
ncbi:DUF418 domain-containing protein [Bacillus atrophaeus]|uniref:DUF418 domain-containing protein n=1 Tax=Bacillus atrophaeus TaxID=1452 RepID=UPI002DB622FF|nr:DUF418 domain-containing protein [Bacillus atrophaeus]MEC1900832.1 DUF418 domain-containing protein [Bacillus atrophaeus]MEC2396667.1 DUF418 domain-containing protein [Bacillus atrophaeus]MED4436322.1 DUF418 domain-containing protein [Bacillus atrophaeus]MED4575031.1 DUF418 domain-containing protein [Bacillus atrophaeus]MED4775252.1 DUF418 domain-containing protein [Bacillus atrophaeus]